MSSTRDAQEPSTLGTRSLSPSSLITPGWGVPFPPLQTPTPARVRTCPKTPAHPRAPGGGPARTAEQLQFVGKCKAPGSVLSETHGGAQGVGS